MSGSSSSNSWTILSSEETSAETLKPVAPNTQQHDGGHESTAVDKPHCEENHKPPNGAESAEGPPVEDYLISKETSDQSGDLSSDHPSSSSTASSRELIPPEGLSQSPAHGTALSSDPQTLTARSPDEPTSSLLGTETLGSAELTQDEKSKGKEGFHLQNEEQLHREDGGPDRSQRNTDSGKGAASPGSPDVGEEGAEKTREVGEQQQQQEEKRRKSLLSALEQIGRREEEEEEEEDFQMPQREDDSVLSLNKCILGAVILLGIGTIFFSGVLMDLDGEGDHVTREMRDADAPGKQEWLSPEALPPLVDADASELLNKLVKGNQRISVLQAQLQAQNEELKVARGQAAEGAKERLRWEEVEKENSRLKTEMASLPVLQNENERMKKELESVPALQKELETLRSTVTGLKLSSATTKSSSLPPTGQPGERSQPSKRPWEEKKKKDLKTEKFEASEKKQQKKREKPPWKEEEKQESKDGNRWEWNKWKQERGRSDEPKERAKRQSDGTQQLKGKDGKKEKADRGEGGKPWMEKVGEKREWMEKKEWKKEKHGKVNQDQQRETKEWKGGKDRGQKHRETQDSKAENEQKKGKDGFKKSGEEWKEKGVKKEYGCRDTSKNRGTEGKGGKHREDRKNCEGQAQKNERKRWNEDERKSEKGKQEKEWKGKDEKLDQRKKREENWKSEGAKEKKKSKDKQHSGKNGNEHKPAAHEHLYGEQAPPPPPHTHHKPAVGQPEYWARQRSRLQHDPRAPQHCDSPEACAQAERLRPVPLAEFEAVLQSYLVKAQEAGVEDTNSEELRKLASDFFKDGVFMHTQMSFQSFAEDVADILEDFVDVGHEGEEDSELEDEMEGFEQEVMEKFSVEAVQEKEERVKGQRRKENGHNRG